MVSVGSMWIYNGISLIEAMQLSNTMVYCRCAMIKGHELFSSFFFKLFYITMSLSLLYNSID